MEKTFENIHFVKIIFEIFLPTFIAYFFIAVFSFFLQKRFSLQLQTEANDSKYIDRLSEISGELISGYKTELEDESFDKTNEHLKKNILKLFSTFDGLFYLNKTRSISPAVFDYWDNTINKMMKEKFYKEGWKYANEMDYYTDDFIIFMNKKIN